MFTQDIVPSLLSQVKKNCFKIGFSDEEVMMKEHAWDCYGLHDFIVIKTADSNIKKKITLIAASSNTEKKKYIVWMQS